MPQNGVKTTPKYQNDACSYTLWREGKYMALRRWELTETRCLRQSQEMTWQVKRVDRAHPPCHERRKRRSVRCGITLLGAIFPPSVRFALSPSALANRRRFNTIGPRVSLKCKPQCLLFRSNMAAIKWTAGALLFGFFHQWPGAEPSLGISR